jgi:hypothetical protein
MDKYLVITIDVEPDCTPNWRYSSPLRFDGVAEGIANRLQPLFNKYDMAPTYLVNNVVLEDEKSCRILRSLDGKFELGTHLHPEFIEPAKTEWDYAGKKGEANCCFLPPDVEFEKIKSITDLFIRRFSYSPVSFRAGRFSAGPNTIESLARLGYKVDTSVTPHVNWNDKTRERPVDYTSAGEQPYFIQPGNYPNAGHDTHILEVPVTISLRKVKFFKELRRTYFGLRHQFESRRPVWLRPVFSGLRDFIELTEEYAVRYSNNDIIIYNMMFHNVEAMPALSPYTKTEQDCAAYLGLLENFFIFCSKNNIRGLTLADVGQIFQ